MTHFAPLSALLDRFRTVRAHTERLAASLTDEDQCVQSMPDASPAKWHRAHTTWFFEQFVLQPHLPGYVPCDDRFAYLFNSYYESVGARQPRPTRGLMTRPGANEVGHYRAYVDDALTRLLAERETEVADLVTLGLHHEQQHQELLQTDMLHAFAQSPLVPAVQPGWREPPPLEGTPRDLEIVAGIVAIGHAGPGFAFDCEGPRHDALLQPYHLADRLVRNADWLDFIADGGYREPTLWMSDGWTAVQAGGWEAPLYWRQGSPSGDDGWNQIGPGGLAPLAAHAPVRHISWYEADAYARWAGARLPTEFELEAAAGHDGLLQWDDYAWQWTGSAYLPYPGFRPEPGAIGEYNGKFMINQMTLRGGSLATPPGHLRPSYRNFFNPDKRWQFSGLRLARDAVR